MGQTEEICGVLQSLAHVVLRVGGGEDSAELVDLVVIDIAEEHLRFVIEVVVEAADDVIGVLRNAATGIGTGVETTTASQTVVGKYNNSSVGGLFVVGMGSGTGTTPRKNAIRVREDGTLLVRPSGDLSMGGFASGEQP